jgi:hypothetical protein
VSKVSSSAKVGIAARLAAERAAKNRWVRALAAGVAATAKSFTRVFHVLWLEVTGFLFLVIAVVGALALRHEYSKYRAGQATAERLWIPGVFVVLFAYFGVSSFWRARRKR